MEVDCSPDIIDGALVSIQDFSERYQLAIASGAIYTPGRVLHEILAGYGIMGCYSGFAYSDEVQSAKLHPCIFEEVAHQLGTRFAEMLNVGDRDPKDILGARAFSMKAILFTGARKEGSAATSAAEAAVDTYADLVATVDRLSGLGPAH